MASLPERTRVIVQAPYLSIDGQAYYPGDTPDLPTGLALCLAADGKARLMPWLAPRPSRPAPQVRRPLPLPASIGGERAPRPTTGDPDDEPILPQRAPRPSHPAHGRRRPRRAV